jgi:hypothetical protein
MMKEMKRRFLNIYAKCIFALMIIGTLSGCNEIKEYSFDQVVYLDHQSLALYRGDEWQLSASPASERDAIQWTSEDTNVATVSSAGLITATGVGETRILASLGTGKTSLSVTVTVPTADRVTGITGNRRAGIELEITNDRVKTVKITRLDNEQSQETEVNFQSGTVTVYYTGLAEGKYSFRVVCIDRHGNESAPVDISVQVFGDVYQSTLKERSINVVTKFGNGYAISLETTSGLYSELFYKNSDGNDVVKKVAASDYAVYLYDYDGSGFNQITYFLPTSASVDTFTIANTYTGTVNDRATVITSSADAYVKPGDFDIGGDGVGFHDSSTGHEPGGGANYRSDLGDYLSVAMDIEGDGGNIGFTSAGEWVMYTVDVRDEGNYEIDWNVSVNDNVAICHIEVDGNSSEAYSMVNNGHWSDWRYYCERNGVAPPVFHLTRGKHTVKYVFNSGGFNYNGLRFRYKP